MRNVRRFLKHPAFWFVLVFLLIPVLWHTADTAFAQLSNQYYNNRMGADQWGNYGANFVLKSLAAATTGTVMARPSTTSKKLVIEKIIASADAEVNLYFSSGATTSVLTLPTIYVAERGGIVCEPYIALPAGATFWVIQPNTAHYSVWMRYREIP